MKRLLCAALAGAVLLLCLCGCTRKAAHAHEEGLSAFSRGDYAAAEAKFAAAAEEEPECWEHWACLARVRTELSDDAGALEAYREAAGRHPQSGDLWYRLGVLQYRGGALREAEASLKAAEEAEDALGGQEKTACGILHVQCLLGLGEEAEAEKFLARLRWTDGMQESAAALYARLGDRSFAGGDMQEALRLYEEGIYTAGENVPARLLYGRAAVLEHMGEFDAALIPLLEAADKADFSEEMARELAFVKSRSVAAN